EPPLLLDGPGDAALVELAGVPGGLRRGVAGEAAAVLGDGGGAVLVGGQVGVEQPGHLPGLGLAREDLPGAGVWVVVVPQREAARQRVLARPRLVERGVTAAVRARQRPRQRPV